MNDVKEQLKEILAAVVVVDPHGGKTVNMLADGEELDVGQIEDLTREEIEEMGFVFKPNPVFLYYDENRLEVAEYGTKKFDNLDQINDYISSKKIIFCRWIKRHRVNGNYVMSVFDEMSENFSLEKSNAIEELNLAIIKLQKIRLSEGKSVPTSRDVLYRVLDIISNPSGMVGFTQEL